MLNIPKNIWTLQGLAIFTRRKKLGNVEKLATNLQDKSEYLAEIKSWKQAFNYGLILQNVYREISFNQDEWLKLYIEMNTELRKNAKNNFKLMNNAVFGKTIEK